MQVISFMNMKGGVGKTTLAVNVAYALASVHKKNILIVDGDPQFNATQYLVDTAKYLKHVEDPKKGTLRDIFVPKAVGNVKTVTGTARGASKSRIALGLCSMPIYASRNSKGKLDLIPATLNLMEIETSKRGTEAKLNAYLKEKATGYDYVIIDCPPTISIFTQAAILASDKYVVPVKPDPLSVIGLPLLERWLDDYTDDAGKTVAPVGLVFTMVRGNTPAAMRDVMDELRAQRGDEVFEDHLSEATAVAESVSARAPIHLHKPAHKTARQILGITNEFLSRTSGD